MIQPLVLSVNEYAAELRRTSDPASRRKLVDGLYRQSTKIVHRTMRKAFGGTGGKADIEDEAQELLVPFIDRVGAGRIPPRHGEEEAYLQKTARHAAYDILKKKGRHAHRRAQAIPDGYELRPEDPFGDAQAAALKQLLTGIAQEVLPQLSDNHREVIELRIFEGMRYTEIGRRWHEQGRAATPKKGEQNATLAFRNGIKKLRLLLEEQLPEDA